MKVYRHPKVQAVYELHRHIILDTEFYRSVKGELTLFVDNLYQQFKAGDARVAIEVSNYHPDYAGKPEAEIMKAPLALEDFQLTIAREYGFEDWPDVAHHGNVAFDHDFEQAVNYLLAGEKEQLEALLLKKPELLHQHSVYNHKAGLIHYIAANGVELWRQVVPANLPEITKMLLDKGADPQMKHHIYRGNGDLAGLIETSTHPREAGITTKLLALVHA